jgi:hypothetical protein
MKLILIFLTVFSVFIASATVVVDPPLTDETLVGVWEALNPQWAPHLWHMEINKNVDSYLVEVSIGLASDAEQTSLRSCVVRKLVFSEVRNGNVTLHFATTTKDSFDLWVTGIGEGTESRGGIDAALSGKRLDSIPHQAKLWGSPEKGHYFFIKGTWMRDLGKASEVAEIAIKEQPRSSSNATKQSEH